MVTQMKELLACYKFKNKVVAYVKDKGCNHFTFVRALTFVTRFVYLWHMWFLDKKFILEMHILGLVNMFTTILKF
jgi:hypothetical protein